ncbi:type I restriction endonuclease subunit R [Lolliginicoccus suaedae]|uniref:type I restriction endonuclease subunit R n=1 Tax=Lolliginicoccus suaedae TaxID=2605429 RepID=UPI0011EF3717|nr:type I restriction endonuclease subunit R [Lolliginicoccus suaedae]
MTRYGMSEADWEQSVLDVLGGLDWRPAGADEVAPGSGEREDWADAVIPSRLLAAIQRLNPGVPAQYLKQAAAEVVTPKSQDAIAENHRIHTFLVDGYRGVSYFDADGQEHNPTIRLVSSEPSDNDWLVVNQVTVRTAEHERRLDVVLYCNGMPVSIVELKRASNENATVASAHAQLRTYVREFPLVFRFCVFTLISDGVITKYGTPFTPLNHYSPWNVDDNGQPVEPGTLTESGDAATSLDVALDGLYNQERFLQLLRSFTAFDQGGDGLVKRIAKPHQYFAVTKAVGSTVQAVRSNGKAGVVWHTQGSGKSMEMELYANLVARHPQLLNPTIVVITDRNELDGQLFAAFDQSLLLPEKPKQIKRRAELRASLQDIATGGIFFTTLQKFGRSLEERDSGQEHPQLSDRRNIIVIVDEAHRSHYDDLDGYARHLKDALPNATLIAFTGTPISDAERDTREVFGDYIDVYDLTRAVEDGATVPVYFEPRLVKVTLAEGVTQEQLDTAADEATAGLDDAERDRIEKSVAVVNAVYGAPERLAALAEDIVAHWENRRIVMRKFLSQPGERPVHGKAMIVCSTRKICADLYSAIVRIRPDWHADALDQGRIKVVYSGTASDEPPISDHVRRDGENAAIKARLKDPADELEIVLVKDMMLTGYDSPPLHTLYLDRPLKGALLMQTLARVNRTFRDKQDGLMVGYAPLVDNLHKALAEYTGDDRAKKPVGKDINEAIALTETLLDQLRALLKDHDWKARLAAGGPKCWTNAVMGTVEWLREPRGSTSDETTVADRYRQLARQLSRAWALCSGSQNLSAVQREVRFYEEVRVWMAKFDAEDRAAAGEPIPEEIARQLGELIATATDTDGVIDIYDAAGIPRPSLDDLNPDYITKTKNASHPHLAIEALRKVIAEEARHVTRHNIVRQRAFSDRIDELMRRYTNQQLTAAEVIAEMIEMAKEVAGEANRGKDFNPELTEDELAFYDAVAQNESAVDIQGTDVLAKIARDLVKVMQRDVRTDWTVREDVRAKLRSSIKRLLVIYKYPPDKQPEAIKLVMQQMETMAPRLASARAGE